MFTQIAWVSSLYTKALQEKQRRLYLLRSHLDLNNSALKRNFVKPCLQLLHYIRNKKNALTLLNFDGN